jgi:hypothetical protein
VIFTVGRLEFAKAPQGGYLGEAKGPDFQSLDAARQTVPASFNPKGGTPSNQGPKRGMVDQKFELDIP